MKKLLTVCACAALLLSGCQTQPGNQTSSVCENAVISMDSNVYQCDFIDLYEQARQFAGVEGTDNLMLYGVDLNDDINMIFTPDGEIRHMEIGFKSRKFDEDGNLDSRFYKISNGLTNDPLEEEASLSIKAEPVDGPSANLPLSDEAFSDFWKAAQFLSAVDLQEIIEEYHVGSPTAYYLKSGPINTVRGSELNDTDKNVICLDCTQPENVRQIDRIFCSEDSVVPSTFEGYSSCFAIFPYYESGLTTQKMCEDYYSDYELDNVILLFAE